MAAVLLQKSAELCREVLHDLPLADQLMKVSEEVEEAVNRFGIVDGPFGEKIFAYQVDGQGAVTLMDDATRPNRFCCDWPPLKLLKPRRTIPICCGCRLLASRILEIITKQHGALS